MDPATLPSIQPSTFLCPCPSYLQLPRWTWMLVPLQTYVSSLNRAHNTNEKSFSCPWSATSVQSSQLILFNLFFPTFVLLSSCPYYVRNESDMSYLHSTINIYTCNHPLNLPSYTRWYSELRLPYLSFCSHSLPTSSRTCSTACSPSHIPNLSFFAGSRLSVPSLFLIKSLSLALSLPLVINSLYLPFNSHAPWKKFTYYHLWFKTRKFL